MKMFGGCFNLAETFRYELKKGAPDSIFAICGFANFSSVGMQIGGIGALVPERRADLAKLGLRALVSGTLASYLSATIAGMLL